MDVNGEEVRAEEALPRSLANTAGGDAPPGYKRTEAGVIPRDWSAEPLLNVLQLPTGQVDPRREPYPSMVLVAPDHVEPATGRLLARETAADQRAISGKYLFKPGDIVYSKIRPYLRKAILADSYGLCSADMYPLSPARGVAPGFMLAVVLGHHFSEFATRVSARSGIPKINREELAQYRVALPSASEQRAIAEALSDVGGLLGALEALIAKKRAIREAAMQQLLTGKTRLPGFGGEWETVQVHTVISRYFCGPSPTCEERNIEGEEWGVLKTTAVTRERGWDWRKHKVLPRDYWGRDDQQVQVGDVIVTKAGPRHRVGVVGWVDYVPDRIIVSGKMIGLRPDPERAQPLLLAAALLSKETQVFLDQRTTGMAESQVNFENAALLQSPISLPSIIEQRAIAAALYDIDGEIAALEARREKTRAMKQGMMQQLLTGRVRLVKPAPLEVSA